MSNIIKIRKESYFHWKDPWLAINLILVETHSVKYNLEIYDLF